MEPETENETLDMPSVRYADMQADAARTSITFPYYRGSDPLSAVEGVDPDAFFDPRYDTVLAMMIKHVVDEEGPSSIPRSPAESPGHMAGLALAHAFVIVSSAWPIAYTARLKRTLGTSIGPAAKLRSRSVSPTDRR